MDKNLSYKWALAVAVLFFFIETLFIAAGMTLDTTVTLSDYFAFFIAGLMVGAALIFILRRSPIKSAVRGTLVGFAVGIPCALIGLFLGAPSGPFGTVLFTISPSIFAMILGYAIGRISVRKK